MQIGAWLVLAMAGAGAVLGAEDAAESAHWALIESYFAEPSELPFEIQLIEEKQETGYRWREFTYTSIVYRGEPVRVHALYAVPDGADAQHRVPGIVATHGADTGIRGTAGSWYTRVVDVLAKGGYAVLFYDWDFKPTPDWDPAQPDRPRRFTHYGPLDFRKTGYWSADDEFRASLHYQAMMAGRRAITWLAAQPEIEAGRIGVFGSSYGGIFSSMLAGIDRRVMAANPQVYTADFGPREESYNQLPGGFSEAEVAAWRERFDSSLLLRHRSFPILYTIGANDPTFLLTKAQRIFAAMNEPKHLLIGPNEGHGYWDLEQTVLFFDSALKEKGPRPAIRGFEIAIDGRELTAAATVVADRPRQVELFIAPVYEIDPERGLEAIFPDAWKWTAVEAQPGPDGRYTARWPLPVMRPVEPRERLYAWGAEDVLDLAAALAPGEPLPAERLEGAIRAFLRVTDQHGVRECTPLAEPLRFLDPPPAAAPVAGGDRPVALEGAARARTPTIVEIRPEVPAGQPMATLDLPLPVRAVGTSGYVLWNWRQQPPSPTLITDGAATPTKRILAPFADTFGASSFVPRNWLYRAFGGSLQFAIGGQPAITDPKRPPWHGALREAGANGMEELSIDPGDDRVHRLTLAMPAAAAGTCFVRVSLIAADGTAETVRYHHTAECDQILQFRFAGKVTLRIRMTSQPERNWLTMVGPSALFLD